MNTGTTTVTGADPFTTPRSGKTLFAIAAGANTAVPLAEMLTAGDAWSTDGLTTLKANGYNTYVSIILFGHIISVKTCPLEFHEAVPGSPSKLQKTSSLDVKPDVEVFISFTELLLISAPVRQQISMKEWPLPESNTFV